MPLGRIRPSDDLKISKIFCSATIIMFKEVKGKGGRG